MGKRKDSPMGKAEKSGNRHHPIEEVIVHLRGGQAQQTSDSHFLRVGKPNKAPFLLSVGSLRDVELLRHLLLRQSKPCSGSFDLERFHDKFTSLLTRNRLVLTVEIIILNQLAKVNRFLDFFRKKVAKAAKK